MTHEANALAEMPSAPVQALLRVSEPSGNSSRYLVPDHAPCSRQGTGYRLERN